MYGSSPPPHTVPDEAVLLRTLAHLDEEGSAVSVVRIVERWSDLGALPVAALVAEARAFLRLFQVDRAWMRIKEALAQDPDSVDALVLLVEVFLHRGWPERASEPLKRLDDLAPRHARLDALKSAVAGPVVAPPADARGIERSGDAERILPLVEHYLATGSVLRAQSLLERLHRGGAGDETRIAALLWGIRGEYLDGAESLEELVSSLGVAAEPEEWAARDHTESMASLPDRDAGSHKVDRTDGAHGRVSFPSLFRRASSPAPALGDEDEVTMAAVMAGSEELQDPPTHETFAHGMEGDGDPDSTQVLDIIGSHSGPASEPVSTVDPLRRPLDLRSLQALHQQEQPDGWADDADDDLVVLMRREPLRDPATEPTRHRLVGVIEKVPLPPPLPEGLPGEDEETPAVSPALALGVPDASDESNDTPAPTGGSGRRRVAHAVGVGVGLVGLLWCGVRYMEGVAADGIVDEVHRAVLQSDAARLEALSLSLREQVDKASAPAGTLAAELALVDSILYREHTGGLGRLGSARKALAIAASSRATPSTELALAEGALRWAEGDGPAASAALRDAPEDSLLRARIATEIALEGGDPEAVRAAWVSPGLPASAPWLAALAPGVAALSQGTEAAAAEATRLQGLGDLALVPVLADGWTGAAPAARLKAIDALLSRATTMPAQQTARLQAARALLLLELGRDGARVVAEETVRDAPHSAPAWHAAGAIALHDGRVREALDAFTACADVRPADEACARGGVQTLIELDRLDEAARLARSPQSRAWVAAERGEPAPAVDGPLGVYAASIAAVQDPSLVSAARLAEVVSVLKASSSVLDQLLAPRAEALRLRLLGDDANGDELRALMQSAGQDPIVAVHLAARAEDRGDMVRAASLLAAGALRSPESARVHHARGLLLYAPSTLNEARSAWRRYLDLGPSGPRAARVRERLGR